MKFLKCTLALACSLSSISRADDITWDGSNNNNWKNNGNWTGGDSPQAGDKAIFPGNVSRNEVDLSSSSSSGSAVDRNISSLEFKANGNNSTNGSPHGTMEWYFKWGRLLPTGLISWNSSTNNNTLRLDAPIHVPGGESVRLAGAVSQEGILAFYGDFSGSGILYLDTTGDDDWLDIWTPQSFTGTINNDGGHLVLSQNGSLPGATVNMRTDSSSTLSIRGGSNGAIGHLNGGPSNITIDLPGNSSLTVGGKNLSGTFNSRFTGSPDSPLDFGLIKVGTGSWTLTNNHAFSHRTKISNGEIILTDTGALKNSAVEIESNGTLTIESSNEVGAVNGNGTVQINDTLLIGGANFLSPNFTGTLNGSGTLTQNSGAFFELTGTGGNFNGEVVINDGKIKPGTTRLADSLVTINIDEGLDLTTNTTLGQLGGTGSLTLDHNLIFGGNNSDCLYTGALNGAGTLRKNGTGTWFYNNTTDTTGAITIADGQLGGSGILPNNVTVNNGAAVAPGSSTGTLTFSGDLDLDGGLQIEIDGNANDRIDVTGNFDPRTSTLNFSEIGSGVLNTTYIIATYGSRTGGFASVTGLPFGYELIYDYDDGNSSNNIAIVETHIPALESISVIQSAADPTFLVTFDYPVQNIDASDFQVSTTGLTGTPVISVTGTGPDFQVTVTGLLPDGSSGQGTISLQFTSGAVMNNRLGDPVPLVAGQSIIPVAQANFTAGALQFSQTWNARGADTLIVLALAYDQWDTNFNGSASATFGGQAMTRVVKETFEVGPGSEFGANAAIFYLTNPPAGDQNLVVKMLGAIPDDTRKYWVGALACSGIDQSNPVTTFASHAGQTDHTLTLSNLQSDSLSVWSSVFQYAISGQTQINGSWYGNHPGAEMIVANQFPGAGNPGALRRAMKIDHDTAETITIDPDSGQISQTGVSVAANFAPASYTISFPTADSITPSTNGPTNGSGLTFDVDFSEDVQNFDAFADLVLNSTGTATATGATISGSGSSYTVTLTGIDGDGTLALAVSNGSDVENLAGLPLATSVTSAPVTIDTTYPTVIITTSETSPTNANSITYDLAFSEPITGLIDHTDFYITGTTVATTDIASTQIVNSGDDQNFTLTLNNINGDGFLQFRLRRNQITDAAGNKLAISQTSLFDPFSPSLIIDNTAPIISLNGPTTITQIAGNSWTDPGATADDASPIQIGGDTVLPSFPGVYHLTYDSTDAAGNAAIQVTRTVTIISVYDGWTSSNELTGNDALPTSDPEGDAKTNLEEFAFDGDPNSSGQENKTVTFVTSIASEDYLAITLPVQTGATFSGSPSPSASINGITYTIQGTGNLTDWTEAVLEVTPAETTGLPALSIGWEYRTFRIAQPTSGFDQSFLRIAIQFND